MPSSLVDIPGRLIGNCLRNPSTNAVPRDERSQPGHAPRAKVPHARSYAAEHGHLAVSTPTNYAGFPLESWLLQQRRRARSGRLSAPTLQELTALDPWWNPPWPFIWQRHFHQYRTTLATGQPLPPELKRWACKQTTVWDQLHPHQQGLLTAIGLHALLFHSERQGHLG